jgi:hypothetical protein
MFRIESKFVAESETKVVQYRRLVTPLFYIKLKSFTYRHLSNKPRYIGWPVFLIYEFTGWVDDNDLIIRRGASKKNDGIMDGIEFAVSQIKPSNVVSFPDMNLRNT